MRFSATGPPASGVLYLEIAVIIDDLPNEIDSDMLLRIAGYSDKRPAPPRLVEAAERTIERTHALARPRTVYEVHETAAAEDGAVLLGGRRFTGKILAKVLGGSDLAAVYAATLGPELDAESSRLSGQGDVLSSVLLDTAGSLVLGKASITFIQRVFSAEAAPRGFAVTPPSAPASAGGTSPSSGYCLTSLRPPGSGLPLPTPS